MDYTIIIKAKIRETLMNGTAYLEELQRDIKQMLMADFKGLPIGGKTLKEIQNAIINQLRNFPSFTQNNFSINVHNTDNGTITITPFNLYSLLWLHGIQVPYNIIRGESKYRTSYGTFHFDTSTGMSSFTPIKPVDYIYITVNLKD